MQPVFLSPLVEMLTGSGQVSALAILQHIINSYGAIDEISLKKNVVKMMGPYDLKEPLSRLINKFDKGRESTGAERQTIANVMMVSKDITRLSQMTPFNKDIR